MESDKVEIIQRHIIHYACGCTTTRIEVRRGDNASVDYCGSHHLNVTKEESITEYQSLDDNQGAGCAKTCQVRSTPLVATTNDNQSTARLS